MSKRQLFEIWETAPAARSWHVQMVNYIAHFERRENAEQFITAIKQAREQDAKSVVKKSK